MLNPDYKEMLKSLEEEGAEFILVGAYAMAAHGYPRGTADMDLWVNPASTNAGKVFRALARFGAPLKGVSPADFQEEDIVFQIGVAPCRIDVLTTISGGISFADAAARAEKITIGDVLLPVLSLKDLIKNKLATGRPKDLEDAEILRKLPQ